MILEKGSIPLPEGLEVSWDRGIDEGYGYTVYGWIERLEARAHDEDAYMDFLILTIMKKDQPNGTKKGEIVWWATSSAKWSEKIHNLWFPEMVHVPCVKYDTIMEMLGG